ncbi:MAG: type II CRISPR RNA-guided endonuclease Cas9, partial [Campylobacteraceae bacterium]|nr:type II CRISPR RNA-guided endonuclease Cas9 [Campylobacteraceae bacterium]
MSKKVLGLDIGIGSVGWSVISRDDSDRNKSEILQVGVRIFTKAENPKNGSSLALPRREARGLRRVLKRKRVRLNHVKKLFEKYLDIPLEELKEDENIFIKKVKKIDVWQLRSDGLKRALNDEEFARVLTHIAKHRGYKSNRKSYDEKDQNKEKQVVLAAIKQNKQLLENYITIGQAIYESTKDTGIRRNKPENYSHSISREMLEDEVTIIFQKQRELQNKKANNEFENEYKEIAFKQNPLKSIEKMVGKCTLEKGEKRAPKRSYSAEEFVTLSKLINTKLILPNMDERYFSKDELQKLMELCQDREKPTFKLIRTTINLDDDIKFKGLNYYDEKTGEVVDVEKNEKFKNEFNGFHSLKKITEKTLSKTCWHNISRDKELLNNIATIFSANKDEELIKKELEKLSFPSLTNEEKNILIDALLKDINFSKYNNLSVKAIEKLLPIMYEGKRYDEAVKIVYGEVKNGTKEKFLRDLNDDEKNELTNPVVKRAISQTRKVINAVIRKYGSLDEIHIELSREVKKSFQDRKEIEKKQKENYENKQGLIEDFKEKFPDRQPTSRELEKFALWKEQGGYCIYSDKKPISIDNLLIDGFCEVDHILPYSRSWDNSRSNKVLCLSIHNQQKKDKIPHKYLAEDVGRSWHQYKEFIESLKNINGEKRKKLLKESFDENSEKEFQNRNFHD